MKKLKLPLPEGVGFITFGRLLKLEESLSFLTNPNQEVYEKLKSKRILICTDDLYMHPKHSQIIKAAIAAYEQKQKLQKLLYGNV